MSVDGKDIDPTKKWTTQEAKTTLEAAVSAAQAVVDNTEATQAEVNEAVTTLAAAVQSYIEAQEAGTKDAEELEVDTGAYDTIVATVPANNDDEKYTSESWYLFAEKIADCNLELTAEDGQDALDAEATKIQEALDLLVEVEDEDPVEVNKDALTDAIAAVEYVGVSEDGKDIDPTEMWTTEAAKSTLEAAVSAAQAVVDNTEATQADVDEAVTTLEVAVSTYESAQKAGTKEDETPAQVVIDAIEALPAVDDLILDNKDAVVSAREAYNVLTEAQQALVTNFEKLEAAEAKIAELEEDDASTEEANSFRETHAEALALTVDNVTIDNKEAVNAALLAYEELSEAAQAKLTDEKFLLDELLVKVERTVKIASDEQLEITIGEKVKIFNVVNRDYTDNSVKSVVFKEDEDMEGKVLEKISLIDSVEQNVSEDFTFKFYKDENKETEITALDLSNGGSTFKVYMEATSSNYNDVSGYVVFKYGSVTIGKDSPEYLTIEDALSKATSGDLVIVKHNTSFANVELATEVYGGAEFEVKKGVTLLLPFKSIDEFSSEEDSTSIKETSLNPNAAKIDRDNPYVELSMSNGIGLNIKGTLTVNAQRTAGTPRAGYVVGGNYAQIEMETGSNIAIADGGTLNSIGFIFGEGIVEAESGSTINEPMFVKSFRGGTTTASLGFGGKVFPFTQYTMNHIEVDLIINGGASHIADALLHGGGNYAKGDLNLIGSNKNDLIQLSDKGQIIRTYDTRTGKVKFDLRKGTASINNASVDAEGITADSKGMDMPLDGTWSFNVGPNTTLSINSWVMLLPGSEMNVENGGVLTVNAEGKLTVFNPYEYLDDYSNGKYPARVTNYYRVVPNFGYDAYEFTKLNIDGTLNVGDDASIAGKVSIGENGIFNKSDNAITEYDVYYVWSTEAKKREVKLWYGDDSTIVAVSDKDNAETEETVEITATVRDSNGDPLKNIEVGFSGGSGTWDPAIDTTDADGKVIGKYTINDTDNDTIKLVATATVGGKGITAGSNIEIGSGGGCPLVYSYDGADYHLEHEPVPYSINKTFETTSHGTLRKLEEVDGQYHIRITEEMETETFVNGFSLYAIDYLADSDIEEVFVDIFGTPHTIQNRNLPKFFVDSKGNSWLEEITTKEKLASSDINMLQESQNMETYEAVFDRPEDSNEMAKFMISTKANPIVDSIATWFYDIIDGKNNIWWLENAIELSPYYEKFIEAMSVGSLEIDLWDGSNWVTQGEIAAGSNLLEEHLVPLDLSIINGDTEDIKVRIRGGAGFFEIDQVSMDFSKDEIENIQKLDLDSALKNGSEEVSHIVDDLDNEQRVKLQKGENIDLYYDDPELEEGLKRGFVVDFKGYFHVLPDAKENEIVDNWGDMNYEEMIDAVLVEQPQAADIIPSLNWLYELAESVNGKSLEYKIEKIIVDNVLPWLNAK